MGIVSDEIKALKPTCFGAAEVRDLQLIISSLIFATKIF